MRARLLVLCLLFAGSLLGGAEHARAFVVQPAIHEIILNPGERKTVYIRVTNENEQSRAYSFSIQKFFPKGDLGQQEFLPTSDTSGLPEWMYVDRAILELGPRESANVPVTVDVPIDAKAGGYYAAFFLSEQIDVSAAAQESVALLPRTGVLFLVTVNGDLIQKAELSSFDAQPYSANRLPVQFEMVLENTGNTHFIPQGDIRIRNAFGQTVAKLDVNANGVRVLPGSRRRINVSWTKAEDVRMEEGFWTELRKEWENFAIGRYEAAVSVQYGEVSLEESVVFYIWPWRLLLTAVVLAFLLLGAMLVARRIKLRKLYR